MTFVWSAHLNDEEDAIVRAQLRPGESVYRFVKDAVFELAARRAGKHGESDGNDKREGK